MSALARSHDQCCKRQGVDGDLEGAGGRRGFRRGQGVRRPPNTALAVTLGNDDELIDWLRFDSFWTNLLGIPLIYPSESKN